MDEKADWRTKIIESFHVVLFIAGAVFFLFGITGGVEYKHLRLSIADSTRQVMCLVGGLILIVMGVALGIWRTITHSTQLVRPDKFGITIVSPQRGDVVSTVDVRGTLRKKPPTGYTIKVGRVYPDNRIYPLREATINPDGRTWEALSCEIGGVPGDRRFLAACLCGPGAAALFAYLDDAVKVHNPLMKAAPASLPEAKRFLPVITQIPPDLVECFRVSVTRG